jgi:hypothetical protein
MLQMLIQLGTKGYVHFSPDSVFSLRIFIGAVAIAMMLKVNTVNERKNVISYLENQLAEGDEIRDQLERDGLIPKL